MPNSYAICVPIYNDWESSRKLIERLDSQASQQGRKFNIVLVDDGSSIEPPSLGWTASLSHIQVGIIRLRRNLGHQRAIAIGLAHIYHAVPCDGVIVMDGDGEDAPEDVNQLIQCAEDHSMMKAIFAQRMKRTESFVFRFFYMLYRIAHYLLIGKKVEVGNFSCLPKPILGRLLVVSELWNHYAAAVVKARFPRELTPIARGRRIDGQSKMNFVSLVMHGLSAISVFSDEVIVRLLVVLGSLFTLTTLLMLILLFFYFNEPSMSWLLSQTGTLLALLGLSLLLTFLFALIILHGRNQSTFIPLRDYEFFILETMGTSRGE